MKIKSRLLFILIGVLSLASLFILNAFATLADQKPQTTPSYSGYVINGREGHTGAESSCTGDYKSHTPTNIKWELYNEGNENSPQYTLYFSIDNEGYSSKYPSGKYIGNTILYAYSYTNNSAPHGNGWAETSDKYAKHPWVGETGISVEDITKIVIGNGITELKDGTFTNMRGVTVIEMPTSLVSFNGTPLKGCVSLSTVYTRGQNPVNGTFNLSYIKNFADFNYTFSCCGAVKQYIFADDAIMLGLPWANFYKNSSLESIKLPEGVKKLNADSFSECVSLKSIILPSTLTIVDYRSFYNCTSLKEITFNSNATITHNEDGVSKADVISTIKDADGKNYLNAFVNCSALEKINAPKGSYAYEFALKFNFMTLADLKPVGDALYSGYVVNGNDGHTGTAKACTGTYETHAKTNIKWELFNEGTEDVPEYALYFSIDNEGYSEKYPSGTYKGNTILYAYTYEGNSNPHGNGWEERSDKYVKHPWFAESGLATESITKIVIGDGITELKDGTFANMRGVTVVEMPTSLTSFNGTPFKGCIALSNVYTRGQSPIEGTFNLEYIKNFANFNYTFSFCQSVKQYIFADDAKMLGLSHGNFSNNTSLESIILPEGIQRIGTACFSKCTSLKSVVLPSTVTLLNKGSFTGATALTEITFNSNATITYDSSATDKAGVIANLTDNSFIDCVSLETINAPIGSAPHDFALNFGFETSHTTEVYDENRNHLCTMTYHPDNYRITIESHYSKWWEWSPATEQIKTFLDAYKNTTKNIVFTGYFGKIHTAAKVDGVVLTSFKDWKNLQSICFPENARLLDYVGYGSAFSGCEALTTVYFGDEANMKVGVADFSGMVCNADDAPNTFTKNLFNNCSSLKSVILPSLNNTQNSKGEIINDPTIYKSTFNGCENLVSITVPSTFDAIESGAFDNCPSLKTINYFAPVSLIVSGTFSNAHTGLIIRCQSYDIANSINSILASDGIPEKKVCAFYKNGMDIVGYMVRVDTYTNDKGVKVNNGLRTVFRFNEEAFAGYNLIEYGTLTASAETWSKYSESWNEAENSVLVGDNFEVAGPNIVKTPILVGGNEYVNRSQSYVERDSNGTVIATHENIREFTITVINFAEKNYKSQVVNCGYEIWEKDGEYFVYFTREKSEGYETTSLYKITLGMLCGGTITLENSNNPVYNTLMGCDHTTFAPQDNVEGYLFEDPLEPSKNVAVYITDSNTTVELETSGLEGTDLKNISYMVYGKNVRFTLPEIDDYWQEHIDAQLATIPEGRSFIAITDTHYQSGSRGNIGKSADLVQYVRKMAGIEKVINLGDPYHQENTYSEAMEQLERSMETKFFDYFGEDGLYAIGNHDSNLTMARGTGDSDSNTYKMDLILSDKDIYDTTFAHIEEFGKKNGNIVYDEELLSIIEANKSEIKAFMLDNVAAKDAASCNNLFGDVNYTAEQMYENLVCWAKMHYAYYDHESKICYIVLNTGGLTLTDFALLNRELWKFHPSQYNFVYTVLNQISQKYSDYDVVVSGHMLYNSDYAEDDFNIELFKMLSAFEGGTEVSFRASGNNFLSGKLFGCTDGQSSKTLSYDFSGRSFSGNVICVTGHRHKDLDIISQTKDGEYYMSVAYDEVKDNLSDNAILCLMFNQDNAREKNVEGESNVQTPVIGTVSEQCFTILTITDDNTVVATRIGANSGWSQKTYKLGNSNEGRTFTAEDTFVTGKTISTYPKTYEAVIKVPKSYTGRGGVIFGNYNMSSHINFELSSYGKPRFYICGKSYVFEDVDIRSDEYVHLAITIENIDSSALTADLKCYVNGTLKSTITGAEISKDFSVASLALGGDLRSDNTQYFKGTMKYAAAYSYARSAEQIAADCISFGGDDPIFCYDLTGRKESTIKDISGNFYDMVKRIEWIENEPALTDYAYSMAVVGDTQYVSINNPQNFHYIYDYILDNVEKKNIKFVIGLGDITDSNSTTEWDNVTPQIKRMDGIVPYSLVRGNHDGQYNMNKYFPYDEYKDVIAGAYEEGNMMNVYHTFSVGNIKYMVICLDYGANDDILAWAGDVIEAHPDHNVIITTHCYLFRDGTTLDANDVCPPSELGDEYNDGDEMWDKLIKKHENIVLVLSGHDSSASIVTSVSKGDNGNNVVQMLVDTQNVDKSYKAEGGLGNVAMFYFSEDGKTVQVRYYSTIQQKYFMNTNQFTFELDVITAS